MTRSMIVSKCHVSLKLDETLMKLSDCALNVYTSTDISSWLLFVCHVDGFQITKKARTQKVFER